SVTAHSAYCRPSRLSMWHPRSSSYSSCDDLALLSFPTRRSSDLLPELVDPPVRGSGAPIFIQATRSATCASFSRSFGGIWRSLRSEEHTSELQSRVDLVCRLLLVKNNVVRIACKHTRVVTQQYLV